MPQDGGQRCQYTLISQLSVLVEMIVMAADDEESTAAAAPAAPSNKFACTVVHGAPHAAYLRQGAGLRKRGALGFAAQY